MKHRLSLSMLVLTTFVLVTVTLVTAQGPQPQTPRGTLGTAFTYQGLLKQNGAPVAGPVELTFSLYNVASGGTALGSITQPITPTGSGLFITQLDFGNLFDGTDRWLGISVGGEPELSPRQALSAAPYALFAASAGALQGRRVATTAPAGGDVLKWDGSAWAPAAETSNTYTAGSGLILSNGQFSVDTSTVQARITGTCTGSNAMQSVDANGSVQCVGSAGGTGDITGVHAGAGLSGGGASGEVTLTVAFAGTGVAASAARSDHNHDATYVQKTGDTMTGNLSFGSIARQMLNLWNTAYAIGVQSYDLYLRTDTGAGFAWFEGGTHSNTHYDPGTGGRTLMTLDATWLHLPFSETVRLDLGSGYKLSLGGNGTFEIDAPGTIGGRLIVKDNGNVGIGNNNPGDKLTVAGAVHSTSGGFIFPDGTTQITAAPNTTYTTLVGSSPEIAPKGSTPTQLAALSLPAGAYLLFATVDFEDAADFVLQDNTRQVTCTFYDESRNIKIDAPAGGFHGWYSVTWHTVKSLVATTSVALSCGARDGGTDQSYVYAYNIRLSAIKLAGFTVQ